MLAPKHGFHWNEAVTTELLCRWPLLSAMQNTQQLDARRSWLNAIDNDKWSPADNQFARTLSAASPADFRVLNQLADLVLDPVALLDGRLWAIVGDVVELRIPALNRLGEPDQLQTLPPSSRLTSLARFVAQLAFASSFETHLVFGSSASRMA